MQNCVSHRCVREFNPAKQPGTVCATISWIDHPGFLGKADRHRQLHQIEEKSHPPDSGAYGLKKARLTRPPTACWMLIKCYAFH